MRTHPIKVIVERLLSNKWPSKKLPGLLPLPNDDPVPEAKPQEDCIVRANESYTPFPLLIYCRNAINGITCLIYSETILFYLAYFISGTYLYFIGKS